MLPVGLIAAAVPNATKDKSFFEGITYTYPINVAEQYRKSATLDKVATDPDQIIAMLRKVYMDRTIPGIYTRGYTSADVAEGGWIVDQDTKEATSNGNYPVNYSGVGSSSYNYRTGEYEYNDAYGWNIPQRVVQYNGRYYIDDAQYVPYEEGYTVLLVEMQDNCQYVNYENVNVRNYETLRAEIARVVKSVRILTESKRKYQDENVADNGTLFKIDCDHLNRFFLISKGKPNTDTDVFLYHMFEQFSPSEANGDGKTDVYNDLVAGKDFPIIHDCPCIPYVGPNGHEFCMLGKNASSDNAHDVTSLMFYIPDLRMKKHSNRDQTNYKYFIYNPDYQPNIEMYVITLNPIDGEQVDGEHVYKLDLSWYSNLSDFLPSDDQEYTLYRVVDGKEEIVYKVDENGDLLKDDNGNPIPATFEVKAGEGTQKEPYKYTDYIKMNPTGQQVTYIVYGQDKTHFLTLKPSNKESYLIPGYDKRERLTLRIDAINYSHFDIPTQGNYYTNVIPMHNNVGTSVTQNFLSAENGTNPDGSDRPQSVFTFVRKLNESDKGTPFVTMTLVEKDEANGVLKFRIEEVEGTQKEHNFEGYHKNENLYECSYSLADGQTKGVVDFGDLVIYDNFFVSTADNAQPERYYYQVQFEAAEAFELEDHSTVSDIRSNNKCVDVFKTESKLNGGLDKKNVDEDVQFTEVASKTVDYELSLQKSTATEINRYNLYRWISENYNNNDVIGHADNTGANYAINVGSEKQGEVTWTESETANKWGTFVDKTAAPNAYDYVPEIVVYRDPKNTSEGEFNTYGAPILNTALGKLNVSVMKPYYGGENDDYSLMSKDYKWNNGDKWYSYYNIYLNINDLEVPDGYEIYKLRAWRKVEGFTGNVIYDGNGNVDMSELTPVSKVLDEILDTREPRMKTFTAADEELGDGWYMYEDMNYSNQQDDAGTQMSLQNLQPKSNGSNYYIIGDRSTKIAKPDGADLFGHEAGEWAYGDDQEAAIRNEKRSTFGALRLKTEDDDFGTLDLLKAQFIVRVYFTPINDPEPRTNAPRRVEGAYNWDAVGRKFYIAEGRTVFTQVGGSGVITGVTGISANREVSGVMYYNTMGLPSVTPWQGVNIVVTRYTDGTTSTTKVVR